MGFTPLMLASGNAILQNEAFRVDPNMLAILTEFGTTEPQTKTANMIASINGSSLSTTDKNTLLTAVQQIPATHDYTNTTSTLRDAILGWANKVLPSSQQGEFHPRFQAALGEKATINEIVNSAANASAIAASTFTTMENLVTGNITLVNPNVIPFGNDLINTGELFNFADLTNFCTPHALLEMLINSNMLTTLRDEFSAVGVNINHLASNFRSSSMLPLNQQKAVYAIAQTITDQKLENIMIVIGMKTEGIETLADLVNPAKLFPLSKTTLGFIDSGANVLIYNDAGLSQAASNLKTSQTSVMPAAIAKASEALSIGFEQITNIANITAIELGEQAKQITWDDSLSDVNSQETAMDPAVATSLNNMFANGTGKNGSYTLSDVIGTVAGYVHSDTYTEMLAILDNVDHTPVYDAYTNSITELGQPTPNVSLIEGYLNSAKVVIETSNLEDVSNFSTALNTSIDQLTREQNVMESAAIYNKGIPGRLTFDLTGNFLNMAVDQKSVMGFAATLHNLALDPEQNEFIRIIANTATIGGQSIIACLDEGTNKDKLAAAGIGTDNTAKST